VRRRRPPHDFSSLVAGLRDSCQVQYICLDEDSLQWLVRPGPIEVSPLTDRMSELPKIVDEYVLDAIVEVAPPRSLALTERDRQWLAGVTLVIGVDERRPDRRQAVATAPVTRLPPGAISATPAYRSWGTLQRYADQVGCQVTREVPGRHVQDIAAAGARGSPTTTTRTTRQKSLTPITRRDRVAEMVCRVRAMDRDAGRAAQLANVAWRRPVATN